jgi:hypothetical protein
MESFFASTLSLLTRAGSLTVGFSLNFNPSETTAKDEIVAAAVLSKLNHLNQQLENRMHIAISQNKRQYK